MEAACTGQQQQTTATAKDGNSIGHPPSISYGLYISCISVVDLINLANDNTIVVFCAQVEEQKRRAEADKLAALTALEARSREFLREKVCTVQELWRLPILMDRADAVDGCALLQVHT